MSYDARLEIDTGGPEPAVVADCGNYTYNCAPMFRRSFKQDTGIRCLDGILASVAVAAITVAISEMTRAPDEYRALNPANGWGDYDSALEWLREIRAKCELHPKATLVIS